jgi:pseudomonalisin
VRPYLRSLAPVFSAFVLLAALLCLPLEAPLEAQTAANSAAAALQPMSQANRVSAQANFSQQTKLTGHIPAWATADRQTATSVDLSAPMNISLVLRRDPAVETAFEQLLADQQNPSSPLYHQWLTPQQIGTLYGPTQADLDAITSWATGQGLKLVSVQPNRVIVELTGSTAAVASVFRTSFANFDLGSETRFSAISEPSIPTALSSVIQSVHGLTQTRYVPQSKVSLGQLPAAGLKPQVNVGNGTNLILPDDFATIYNITSVYSGGDKGATIGSVAQHVAVIGRARVAAADISNFESFAGLPSVQPNVVLAGTDPGSSNMSDAQEATLDVDRVIGTAQGAQVDLVIAKSTQNEDGVDIATAYNINILKDPVMTISFGSCEASNGQTETNLLNTEFQTAAGEGISTFIAAGDAGAAGCDTPFVAAPATQTASINALCASSYVTCVGGTEFNDAANPSTYWSSSNSPTGNESALMYIPEGAWNEPDATNSSGVPTGGFEVGAGGGGESLYIAKPSWQAGVGVPSGAFRYVPDVAFSASAHDGYLGCFAAGQGSCVSSGPNSGAPILIFSGTSAAAPGMAGIAALLNTKLGSAQGNISPLLYSIAASTPSAFHDVTVATSGVTNCTTATPSMCNNSTPGPATLTGGLAGFEVGTGYDEATGLGSLNVANFLAAASGSPISTSGSFTLTPSPTTLTLAPGATTGNTDAITLTATNSFTGSVGLTCAITFTGTGTASLPPACNLSAPSVSLTATNGTSTVTATISTQAASTTGSCSTASLPSGGPVGMMLAGLLLLVLPVRKRKAIRALTMVFLLTGGLVAMSGCSSKSSSSTSNTCPTPTPLTPGTTAGTYTVKITGTSGSTTASTTFTLTIS